jgi:hypothetical protein
LGKTFQLSILGLLSVTFRNSVFFFFFLLQKKKKAEKNKKKKTMRFEKLPKVKMKKKRNKKNSIQNNL